MEKKKFSRSYKYADKYTNYKWDKINWLIILMFYYTKPLTNDALFTYILKPIGLWLSIHIIHKN